MTSLFCAASVLLALQGHADAKGMTIAQLKALVKDLGYDATSDDKSTVTISDQGKWTRSIFLMLQDDGDAVDISSNLGEIPDGAKTVTPYADILTANGNSPYYFSIAPVDGKPTLFLEGYLPTASMTKPALRKALDGWLLRIDATEPTWNQDHWAAAATPAPAAAPSPAPAAPSPTAQKIFCEPGVEKAPLKVENATFRNGPPGGEAGATIRASSKFGPEETMYVLLEITGFQCRSLDKDKFESLFTIDQGVRLTTDPDYDPFLSVSKTIDFDRSNPIDKVFVDLTLHPHWTVGGNFDFRYTVHDNVAGKEATTAMAVAIGPPK